MLYEVLTPQMTPRHTLVMWEPGHDCEPPRKRLFQREWQFRQAALGPSELDGRSTLKVMEIVKKGRQRPEKMEAAVERQSERTNSKSQCTGPAHPPCSGAHDTSRLGRRGGRATSRTLIISVLIFGSTAATIFLSRGVSDHRTVWSVRDYQNNDIPWTGNSSELHGDGTFILRLSDTDECSFNASWVGARRDESGWLSIVVHSRLLTTDQAASMAKDELGRFGVANDANSVSAQRLSEWHASAAAGTWGEAPVWLGDGSIGAADVYIRLVSSFDDERPVIVVTEFAWR